MRKRETSTKIRQWRSVQGCCITAWNAAGSPCKCPSSSFFNFLMTLTRTHTHPPTHPSSHPPTHPHTHTHKHTQTHTHTQVRSRKRNEKRTEWHSLLHALITLTSMVLPANLNMQLGVMREQQQLRGSCLVGKFVFFEGWEPQEARKTRSRAKSAAHSHAIDLYGPACKSKYAAGSPA